MRKLPERSPLIIIALMLCVFMMSASCSKRSSSPNKDRPPISTKTSVVLIIIDTLRADVLGSYGYQADTSPELDQFAKQGVLFKRTVANCSWTRPSIGTMVSSLHGRTLGLYDELGDSLDDRFTLLSEVFRDEGYTTVGITANPNINAAFGFSQGFDHYEDSHRIFRWMEGGRDPDARKTRNRTAKEIFRAALDAVGPNPEPPYYLQLNIMDVHRGGPPLRPAYQGAFDGKVRKGHERYAAALRQASADIRDFVEELTSKPRMGDTLFIFTSDHGEGLTDHPAIRKGGGSHGHVLYESNVIVPLIFYHHLGGLSGREVTEKVQLLDLAPTILDLLGIAIPDQMEGLSLKSLIAGQGPKPDLPEYIITETYFRENDKSAVYSDSFKYFEHRDGRKGNAPREVQSKGRNENGAATNKLAQRSAEAAKMEAYLRKWEAAHPKSEAVRSTGELSKGAIEQLKALGYLQQDGDDR